MKPFKLRHKESGLWFEGMDGVNLMLTSHSHKAAIFTRRTPFDQTGAFERVELTETEAAAWESGLAKSVPEGA